MRAILAEVQGERAIPNHAAHRGPEHGDVETVSRDRLPLEIAAGAEASHIPSRLNSHLMPDRAPTGSTHSRMPDRAIARDPERCSSVRYPM